MITHRLTRQFAVALIAGPSSLSIVEGLTGHFRSTVCSLCPALLYAKTKKRLVKIYKKHAKSVK